ncbi:type II toxin-antitoxin system Phd/YefM family antitoxin [Nostocoides sp. F2B08]|uniref:type II toxin-antitoxin system Phd/YefM family antitoxin n=1 Tax=Nostocoides sp. F2B08 TaxID=2653936 RepID=UPI00186AC35A|nr:type II toxin-antitoxin system Phd/YefM family antitoxin [Tetrasphaera sp. F2B08]
MITIPLAEARANLSRLVDEAMMTHERIEVTKNGRRAAVILSVDDFDSIMETLDVLSDSELVAAIVEGEAEIRREETSTVDEVGAALAARTQTGS